ncbi:hypothetical protein [Trueperella sp. LYQ141]|uniref:hypothetical protein n=1 Tax=Trueperella sp. LYQ141 TaxID=3391058 RepID=UPI003983A188
MTPFFRRKNKNQSADTEPHPDSAPSVEDEPVSDAQSALSADSAAENNEAPAEAGDEPEAMVSIPAPEPTPSREQLLDTAYQQWHEELSARARRAEEKQSDAMNGVIDLTHPHPTGSATFYSGSPVRITSLIRESFAQKRALNNVARLHATVQRMTEIYGNAPVAMSVGRLTWQGCPRSGSAPALMRSVSLTFEEGGDATVRQLNRISINPVVIEALRDHGASHEHVAQLNRAAAEETSTDRIVDMVATIGRMYLPSFAYEPQVLLGCFERPERTIVADLEAMEPYIRTSGIMMALAGDEETRKLSAAPLPPGGDEDRAPEVERGAGDLDVAELNAVEAVASGRSIVLDCPPGSKRTQTVASICADAAASNRSVIVVPSRRSAADSVIAELDRLGLGELVLDFSDIDAVPQRIRTGLRLARPDMPTESMLQVREELVAVRRQLRQFVHDLHHHDDVWQTSVHDILEKLATLTSQADAPQTRVRLSSRAVRTIRTQGLEAVEESFKEAGELGAFDPQVTRSAWSNARIDNVADGADALDRARRLAEIHVPQAISQSSRAAGETGLKQSTTLAQWFEQIDVLDGISDSLDTFLPQIFETSPMNMVIATASREWRDSQGHSMKSADRRRYKKQAMDLVRPGEFPEDIHAELVKVHERREVWRRYSPDGGWPSLPDGMAQIRSTREDVEADIDVLSGYLGGVDLRTFDFTDLQELLSRLTADADHMTTLPQRNAALADLRDSGFEDFLDDVMRRAVPADRINGELELALTAAQFEQLISSSPVLASFGPRDLEELLGQLRRLDREHTASLAGPVLRAVINNARSMMLSRRSETLKLDAALSKGVSHLGDIIATHSRLVQVARPVWVIPPTVLAQYIPPMPWADLVIVDANESVAPLISSMMRGRQAVVVGDTRRPGAGAMTAFSQVLPVAQLPTFGAEYDELATQALTEIGYELQPIPSVHRARSSRFIAVDGRGVPSSSGDGAVETTQVETDAVVDAVLEHAMTRPEESLAVITVSVRHAERVREALASVGSTDVSRLAGFLVTDITRASGIRRDHIILSVGYGKTVHGRVLHTFGALATPVGLAGLIDAIAAAGSQLTIFSALGPGDIDIRRVSTPGPRLLAKLIDQAGREQRSRVVSGEVTDPLLVDVACRLQERGWDVRGAYGYPNSRRIPLVAGRDGTFAVAVVVDDADYVAEHSLRRRDRFWVEALQARGWSVFQTFSSSLFVDPDGQVARIEELLLSRYSGPDQIPVVVPHLSDDGMDVVGEESASEEAGGAEVQLPDSSAPSAVIPAIRPRARRPEIVSGLRLAAYTDDQLDDMVTWIATDGVARDEREFIAELRAELGIERRGEQVEIILRNVVRRSGLIGVSGAYGDDTRADEDHSSDDPADGEGVLSRHTENVDAPESADGMFDSQKAGLERAED